MKSIKYLVVMTFAVLLSVSCNSDDDAATNDNDQALVGTWEATEVDEDIEFHTNVTFNANQTGTLVLETTFGGETETETHAFTWSTSGNQLTMKVNGQSPETSTYSISGNKLTISDEDGVVTVLTKV